MTRNPYVVGPVARGLDFYGRAAELQAILAGHSCAVHLLGGRRIGKSSLLMRIKSLAPAIFIDFQFCGPERFGSELTRQLKRELKEHSWLPTDITSHDPFEILEILDEAAVRSNHTIFLLCDEAEGLLGFDRSTLGQFQRFIWAASQATCTVFSSSRGLLRFDEYDPKSNILHFLKNLPPPLYISGMTDEEANALITRSQGPIPIRTDPETQARIRAVTGNHPYLIQMLCHRLWQSDNTLRPLNVHALVLDDFLGSIFDSDFSYLSKHEQEILQIVSRQNPITGSEIESLLDSPYSAASLETLTSLGHLRETSEGYIVGNVFLEHWLEHRFRINATWNTKSVTARTPAPAVYEDGLAQEMKRHEFDGAETSLHNESETSPSEGEPGYDINAIRELLRTAFTAEELPRFCQGSSLFQPLTANFGPKYNLNEMVDEVIKFCETRHLWEELLEGVQQYNLKQYSRFAPRLKVSKSI